MLHFLQKLPEKIIKEDDHDGYAYEKEPESKNLYHYEIYEKI